MASDPPSAWPGTASARASTATSPIPCRPWSSACARRSIRPWRKSPIATPPRWPETHAELRRICAAAGQARPTPLLLRYGPGDYNRLHQDLYGEVVFPFQVAILLNRPGEDFEGGEFVLVEGRPRMQSQAQVVPLGLGEGVAFAVRERPVRGARGYFRAQMRHGVSQVRSGRRHTLGIIFHDAE